MSWNWLLIAVLMDSDDIIYCILLFVSLFSGHLVKVTNGYVARQCLVSVVGVVMVIVVCRQHCLHALLSSVVNAVILILVNARSVPVAVLSSHIFCLSRLASLLYIFLSVILLTGAQLSLDLLDRFSRFFFTKWKVFVWNLSIWTSFRFLKGRCHGNQFWAKFAGWRSKTDSSMPVMILKYLMAIL